MDQVNFQATPTELRRSERHRYRRYKWLVVVMMLVIFVGLDQWSKHWAHTDLTMNHGGRITIVEDYLAFSYVRNPGAAWGFLSQTSESFRKPFFTVVSLVAMSFILYLIIRLKSGHHLMLWAMALVFSGAVGNFIDRLRFNFVVDFIDFHIKQQFRWPTFNVADAAITVGVALLFLEMFISPALAKRAERGKDEAANSSTSKQPAD